VKLSDFVGLSPVEQGLVKRLRDGDRRYYVVSDSVPKAPTKENAIRATLIRYLALGGCDACRPPETGVRVRGAWIRGDEARSEDTKGLDFVGATLPGNLALVDCHIPDPIILRSAKVKNLFFNTSVIKAEIRADGLQAEGGVFLHGAKVSGEVRLLGARLGGNLDCVGAELQAEGDALICDGIQVEGDIFLSGAKIAGEVRLLGARVGGDLDCIGAELQAKGDALSCDGMEVEGDVFLRGAKVAGEVRLLGARVGGDLDCDGAELQAKGKALNCQRAKITGTFFLRERTKVSGCIDLTDATFGTICDDPACWPPEVILDRCRYGAFLGRSPTDAKSRLTWLALQNPTKHGQDFWPDPYEHCAKVLREMGHNADARAILIEKERLQRAARRNRLRANGQTPIANLIGLGDWLLGITTRYGRQPLLAFVWLLGFWGFGSVIFDQAAQRGEIKPNLPQMQVHPAWVQCAHDGTRRGDHLSQPACFIAQPEGQSYPRFNALVYSADTLFPVVTLEVQSYWIPDDSKPFGRDARYYLWAHIIAGWALTLLAVAGFSGLIKTDSK
jgi:hypothetical protein